MRREDITGQLFGRLTAVSYAGDRRWNCVCVCGASTCVSTQQLKNGHSTSCGCFRKEYLSMLKTVDLSGRKFGRLTVISHAGATKQAKAKWNCICECGTEKAVVGSALVNGSLISCGCAVGVTIRKPSVRTRAATGCANRRARIRNSKGSFTHDAVLALLKKQKGRCAGCRVRMGSDYHRDHILALALGGSNDIHNIQLLCQPCNSSKHAKAPEVWARENGRLI